MQTLNLSRKILNKILLSRFSVVGSERMMASKVAKDMSLIPDMVEKQTQKKLRSKLAPKVKEYFDDSFYHEQLSRLNIIKKGDNVVDSYTAEPIVEGNEDVLKMHSISQEELNILADYIYIDDNGKIRVDKDKLSSSNDNNVDTILKFMCVYLANVVPGKEDYERSLMNLILSSSCAKDMERNLKEEVNWRKVQELLRKNSEDGFDSEEAKKNNTDIKACIEEDINFSSKATSALFDDFKRRCQFPVVYAGGIPHRNHVCVGLVYPEFSDDDEYFKLPFGNVDLIQCYLFSFNEAIKRAIYNNWASVQVSCDSEASLKVVYDLVTMKRQGFFKKYPIYTNRFHDFLDEFRQNSHKLNINWALYSKDCEFAKKLQSALHKLRT